VRVSLIGLAGAAGALSRYWVGLQWGGRPFPWATLGINLIGSLLLGAALRAGADRSWSDTATLAVSVGFLGAFTTFSTFSYEAQDLLRDGRVAAAATYSGLSVVGGIAAAALGWALASAAA
jgi:fluoride exporter